MTTPRQTPGMAYPLESVTVTAQAAPCPGLYQRYLSDPNFFNQVAYGLCTAANKAESLALGAAHWVWGEIQSIWTGVGHIASAAGGAVTGAIKAGADKLVAAGRYAGQAVADAAASAWQHVKDLINWLDGQVGMAEGALLKWGLIILGGLILLEMAPGVSAQLVSHASRHRAPKNE